MNEKIKSVSILGCGWLGLPLAAELVGRGYKVRGSTTRKNKLALLQQNDVEPFIMNLAEEEIEFGSFFESDCLVVTVPPGRTTKDDSYSNQMSCLLDKAEKNSVNRIIFTSSVSVYGNPNTEVVETDELFPETNSAKAIAEAEELFIKNKNFLTTVLRLAGLAGPGREPGKFLAGKQNISGGSSPVNLVHLDDCIKIICEIIKQNVFGDVFNVCCESHPAKKDFYTEAANSIGLSPPLFIDSQNDRYKTVNSEKIKMKLNYTFKFRSPVDFL